MGQESTVVGLARFEGIRPPFPQSTRAAGDAGVEFSRSSTGVEGAVSGGEDLLADSLKVLRMATSEAAETVGAEDHLGDVQPGKLADLVLLDANPLDDIRNTQDIWRAMKGSWIFDPEEIRR